jgi:TRAP-type C4-dicarboxylate transport system permease small subunit
VERLVKVTVDATERAAGIFLAAIVALTFTSIMLRAFLNTAIPDWFDLSRLLLGVAIFWGIATTSYRDEHIQVDFLWEWVGPRGKWLIDLFATSVLFVFMAAFAWMLTYKVDSGFRSGEATFDVRIPIWPFHTLAALGIFLATLLIAIRLVRLWHGRRAVAPRDIKPIQ